MAVELNTRGDFTVENFFRLSSVNGIRTLTHCEDRKHLVTRVTVVESAQLYDWCEKDDIVLTTGYSFYGSPERLLSQIKPLKEVGIAALCIRNTPRNPQLGEEVIAEAERNALPIFQLPITSVFSNIVQESMEQILARRIRIFQDIHQTTEMLLSAMWGADTPEKGLQVVEKAFHNPVMIFDDENELILTPQTQAMLNGSIQEQLIHQIYTGEAETVFVIEEDGSKKTIPLHIFDTDSAGGTVMLLLEYSSRLSDIDIIILNQIGHSLVLEMKNALLIKKIRRKYKNMFIEDLLAGRLGDDPVKIVINGQTDGYRLQVDKPYRVIAINLGTDDEALGFSQKEVSFIRQIILNLDPNILFTVEQGKLILIQEDMNDSQKQRERLRVLAKKLDYVMNKGKMSFCVSDPLPLQKLNRAYAQAMKISEICEKTNHAAQTVTAKDLGPDYLLSMLPQEAALTYYRRILGDIKEHDDRHNGSLLETLRVYLEVNCSKQAAAEKMHIHYNTMVYRLNRIEELLACHLSDAQIQFQLGIAFRLGALFLNPGKKKVSEKLE